MNAANPTRQVALVGEARAGGNFSQTAPPAADELDRALQSQMHDVTVWCHTDRLGEDAREMERAAARQSRQGGDLDRTVKVGEDKVFEVLQHIFCPTCLARGLRRLTCGAQSNGIRSRSQPRSRTAAHWVTIRTLGRQGTGEIEEGFVTPGQALLQLRLERRVLRGCERERGRIDRDQNGVNAIFRLGSTVETGRADGQRPSRRLVP
jgi:hypothetical protein